MRQEWLAQREEERKSGFEVASALRRLLIDGVRREDFGQSKPAWIVTTFTDFSTMTSSPPDISSLTLAPQRTRPTHETYDPSSYPENNRFQHFQTSPAVVPSPGQRRALPSSANDYEEYNSLSNLDALLLIAGDHSEDDVPRKT
ncbi:733_t:CDS:2, partial [Acaulospora colombiana]